MGARYKGIIILIIICFTFINLFVFGGEDNGNSSKVFTDELSLDDYNLVSEYQDVIKAKDGTTHPGPLLGQWPGTALIQGKYNGHSCYALPSVIARDELENPDCYNGQDTCDPPSVSASLENNDVDYCIKGTPGDEGFDAVAMDPSYLYNWSYPGGTTGWTQDSSYNPNPFQVARSESVVTRDISVTINDVFINGQDVYDNLADDGTKSTNHTLVAYRPVYEPRLPHFPHSKVTEVRTEKYLPNYKKVATHTWVTEFYWKEVRVVSPFPTNTGCNCEHNEITFFNFSGLSITQEDAWFIAADAPDKVPISLASGYNHAKKEKLSSPGDKTLISGKTLKCQSEFIDTKFIPVQEIFHVVYDIVYTIEPVEESEDVSGGSLTPPAPVHKEGWGGGNYIDIKWKNTPCD